MSKRLSLTLERDDVTAVAAIADEDSPEHHALTEWAADHGYDPASVTRSESSRLRALIRAGLETMRERAMDAGYAALAASYTDEERAEKREARRRYIERTESKA